MTYEEINLKKDEIINRLQAIALMGKANYAASKKNLAKLQDLVNSGRFDPVELMSCCAETERLKRVSALQDKMFEDAKNDARAFFVTVYGPSGGILFDAFLKELEDS